LGHILPTTQTLEGQSRAQKVRYFILKEKQRNYLSTFFSGSDDVIRNPVTPTYSWL